VGVLDFGLGEGAALADCLVEFSALHVLKDEDDAVFLLEHLVDVDDVGVVQAHQHVDLVLGRHEVVLAHLGREQLPRVLPHCLLHCAVAPVCFIKHYDLCHPTPTYVTPYLPKVSPVLPIVSPMLPMLAPMLPSSVQCYLHNPTSTYDVAEATLIRRMVPRIRYILPTWQI